MVGNCNEFDVSYHIQGRIKSAEIKNGLPFNIELYDCSEILREKRIHIKLLTNSQCQISYYLNKDFKNIIWNFNSIYQSSELKLKILVDSLSTVEFEARKTVDYFIMIHCKK